MELLHEVYIAMKKTVRFEPGLSARVASSLALIVSRLPSSAALLTFAFFVIVIIIMIRLCCQVKDLFSCAVMIYDGIITIHHHYLITKLFPQFVGFLNGPVPVQQCCVNLSPKQLVEIAINLQSPFLSPAIKLFIHCL